MTRRFRHNDPWLSPSTDAWGRLNAVSFIIYGGQPHQPLTAGPLRHLVTQGRKSLEVLAQEQRVIFDPVKIEGATFLDVGAWFWAHSFAAKKTRRRVCPRDRPLRLDK